MRFPAPTAAAGGRSGFGRGEGEAPGAEVGAAGVGAEVGAAVGDFGVGGLVGRGGAPAAAAARLPLLPTDVGGGGREAGGATCFNATASALGRRIAPGSAGLCGAGAVVVVGVVDKVGPGALGRAGRAGGVAPAL